MGLSKEELKAELLTHLAAELEAAERAYGTTIEGATHEEAKPENDKDTRALELSYLARGQAARVEELRTAMIDLTALAMRSFRERPAAMGALVATEENGKKGRFFLAPAGGGSTLASGGVQVVTPKSPLGQVLLGKRPGDAIEVVIAGKIREFEVTDVE